MPRVLVAVLALSGVCIRAAGTPIQDATCGAGDGGTIYVHERTYGENVGVNKRLTLIDEGADVYGC